MEWINRAIELVKPYAKRICVRGDGNFMILPKLISRKRQKRKICKLTLSGLKNPDRVILLIFLRNHIFAI